MKRMIARLVSVIVALSALSARQLNAAFPISAANGVFQLTVNSLEASANYGPARAAPGSQFIVLSTRWENRIDASYAQEQGLALAYLCPDLHDHLFFGLDGTALGQLRENLDDGRGHLSLGTVTLPKPGATVEGKVVFEIRNGSFSSAELRFLDDTAGYLTLHLAGKVPDLKIFGAAQKNPVAEFAIFGFEDPAHGVAAPPGFRAIAVDLRGRSLWTIEGEAPAYDKNPGALVKRVHLLDWPDAHTYLHLLAEGSFAYPAEDYSKFFSHLRFIPDIFGGGRAVFFVPKTAANLSLICEMPHADTPGGTIDLAPLIFPLSQGPASEPSAKAILTIPDEMFSVAITGLHRSESLDGTAASEGKEFISLDLAVTNQGKTGEFFQPKTQLFLLNSDDSETEYDEFTNRLPHRPEEQVHLPANSTRRFQVVYQIDKVAAPVRLSFHGGDFQKTFVLNSPK